MTDTAEALRATSDALLRDLEVLGAIEEEKRSIPAGDPRLVELAERIEQIAHRLLGRSNDQRHLSQTALAEAKAGVVDATVAIEEIHRSMAAILADWREAERRAATTEPGTADATEAAALVEALRKEYRRAFEAAQRAGESAAD
ncbi:MAG TPA: hypothetical protein VEX41_02395 [Candidatus Eisenbacteria bacterium]|nr:hypothetical protein [Candidatus Eisenbacteria bacterium]